MSHAIPVWPPSAVSQKHDSVELTKKSLASARHTDPGAAVSKTNNPSFDSAVREAVEYREPSLSKFSIEDHLDVESGLGDHQLGRVRCSPIWRAPDDRWPTVGTDELPPERRRLSTA